MKLPWCLGLGVMLICLASAFFAVWPRGVGVYIVNAGTITMSDVRVVVTGRSYSIGDLNPGQVRSVKVNPSGESSIEIQYSEASGSAHILGVDCYFEENYRGRITVDIADAKVVRVNSQIRVGPF